MDISLPVNNESTVQMFDTCTIPLISRVNRQKYETTFHIANQDGSSLLSCEDWLYMQLVQPCLLISKHVPHHGHIISSDSHKAYVNFVNRNKNVSHYQAAGCSAPSQTTPSAKPNSFIPHDPDQIKEKYGDIFEGLGKFLSRSYHINIDPTVPLKRVPCKPVPIHQQEEFKHLHANMQHTGITVPSHKAITWISSYVNVESEDKKCSKKMCIFLDPTLLNKADICEPY